MDESTAALRAAHDELQATPNPPWPFDSEELADLIADLFLDHAALHALAGRALRGERIDATGIELAPFRRRLAEIAVTEADRGSFEATDLYLSSMEAVFAALPG